MRSPLAFSICLLVALLPTLAQAQDAELGRLFFTPERRAALDRQRQFNIQEIRAIQGESLSLDGIVQRSSGKRTVWINGRPQTERDEPQTGIGVAINPHSPGNAQIRSGDEAATRLNVGEAINRSTGERDTRLGGGSVARHGDR
jgi:hypothetical protein